MCIFCRIVSFCCIPRSIPSIALLTMSKQDCPKPLLHPNSLPSFFRTHCINPTFRLLLYQICRSTYLFFSIKSIVPIVPTPAEFARLDALHFRVLHTILGVKPSFYHRVLQEDLSHVPILSFNSLPIPMAVIFSHPLNLHLLDVYSSLVTYCATKILLNIIAVASPFTPIDSFRSDSTFRIGRPRPRWSE